MSLIDIWINCPDGETAHSIARVLVGRRLAACANIHPEMESLYWWKGALERGREVPLVVKTRAELFEPVADAVRGLHPDEVPAIHAVAAARVTPDYLRWLAEETAGGAAASTVAEEESGRDL